MLKKLKLLLLLLSNQLIGPFQLLVRLNDEPFLQFLNSGIGGAYLLKTMSQCKVINEKSNGVQMREKVFVFRRCSICIEQEICHFESFVNFFNKPIFNRSYFILFIFY